VLAGLVIGIANHREQFGVAPEIDEAKRLAAYAFKPGR
jgi:hypothetical protein